MLQVGTTEKELINTRYVRFTAFSASKCAKTFLGDKPRRFELKTDVLELFP
jgi:hypothetical protein